MTLPFDALVDAAPDGLIVCDTEGTILLANAETCRMFGYTREELVGQRIEMLVPAAVRARHHQHVAWHLGQECRQGSIIEPGSGGLVRGISSFE